MKHILIILALLCASGLFLVVASCGPAPAGASTTVADDTTTGDSRPAPSGGGSVTDFTLKNVNGQSVSLSDYLGKNIILISFWATWCEPCKKEMVQLQQLYDDHKDKGLMIISISMDEPETQGEVAPYVKQRGYSYQVLIDQEGQVTNRLNPRRAAPFSMIIDRGQNTVWDHEGYVPGDEKKIEDAVLAAIAGPQ